MSIKKVSKGSPLNIPAEAYNAFVDAANAHRGQMFSSAGASKAAASPGQVLVKNSSGYDCGRFSILGIDDSVGITPTDNLTAFQAAFIRRRETAILGNLGFNKATIVAVYGAWLYGQLTVGALSQGGHRVALVVDSDPGKWGHLLAGHLIKDPQELKQRPEIQAVVVTSIGAFEPIQNHIRGMGLGELPIFSIAGGIIRKKHAG